MRIWVFCLNVSSCTTCVMAGACGDQKRASGCRGAAKWVLGIEPESFGRTASTLVRSQRNLGQESLSTCGSSHHFSPRPLGLASLLLPSFWVLLSTGHFGRAVVQSLDFLAPVFAYSPPATPDSQGRLSQEGPFQKPLAELSSYLQWNPSQPT